MKLRAFYKRFLTNSTFEKTAIQTEYSTIDYGEKVILKNSTKSAKQSLLVSIILVTITLYIGSIHLNIVGMLLFCSIILLFPIMKLVNQKPKLIISKDHLTLSNGKTIVWNEIQSTTIEEADSADIASYFKLKMTLHSNQTVKITISDLNYSVSEISHIIAYYKNKNTKLNEFS